MRDRNHLYYYYIKNKIASKLRKIFVIENFISLDSGKTKFFYYLSKLRPQLKSNYLERHSFANKLSLFILQKKRKAHLSQ